MIRTRSGTRRRVMVTITVEPGSDQWKDRTLTLTGEDWWIRERFPDLFPDMLGRALDGVSGHELAEYGPVDDGEGGE